MYEMKNVQDLLSHIAIYLPLKHCQVLEHIQSIRLAAPM